MLSPDKDVSTKNIHYIHMDQVYENLHNQNEEKNYITLGNQNPYDTFVGFTKYSVDVCVGQVTSKGWKELENYPNDFRVIII